MAAEGQPTSREHPLGARLWTESLWLILPGWTFSLLLHGGLVLILASMLRSYGDGFPAGSGGDFADVGIFLKQDTGPGGPQTAELIIDQPAKPPAAAAAPQPIAAATASIQAPSQDLATAPTVDLSAILSAAVAASQAARNVGGAAISSGTGGGTSGGGLGPGETSFFGIRSKGARFVYVLDSSGSMLSNDAIEFAKAELMASLASLDESQQFEIIFYNEKPRPMMLNNASRDEMYRATDANRTLARQFVLGLDVAGGTDHMPALAKALSLKPDIVYFLTDAGPPILRAGDLEDIRKLNKSRTRINCIEFGRGPELATEVSSLKSLARQSGGTYRYRDVLQFQKATSREVAK